MFCAIHGCCAEATSLSESSQSVSAAWEVGVGGGGLTEMGVAPPLLKRPESAAGAASATGLYFANLAKAANLVCKSVGETAEVGGGREKSGKVEVGAKVE